MKHILGMRLPQHNYERFYCTKKRYNSTSLNDVDSYLDASWSKTYKPSSLVNFDAQRITLMQVNMDKWGMFSNHHKMLKGVNVLTSYCMVRNIMKGRPIRTLFWMVPTCVLAM